MLKRQTDHRNLSKPTSSRPQATGSLTFPPVPSFTQDLSATPKVTSETNNESFRRSQAIRTPLIHLLAIRPFSTKYLAQHINCSQDDIANELRIVGKESRLDPSKWDLKDKSYKHLDVWKFKYKDSNDRDLAIQRAISAFGRLRMSQQDPQWEMLNPPDERGKGKTLSRLTHLQNGQIPVQPNTTPRIHVQQPEEGGSDTSPKEDATEPKGRLTPKSSDIAAQVKHGGDPPKAKSLDKEAKTKRLLPKGLRKATAPSTTSKNSHPAVRKGGKKVVAPKSEEFVHDSDEDGESKQAHNSALPPMPESTKTSGSHKSEADYSSTKQAEKQSTKPKSKVEQSANLEHSASTSKPTANSQSPTMSKVKANAKGNHTEAVNVDTKPRTKKIPTSPAYTPSAKYKMSESSQVSTAMQKSLSRARTLSSPHKPSPLGSSPPTNASEFDNHLRSSPSMSPPSNKRLSTPNGVNGVNGHLHSAEGTPMRMNGYHTSTPSSSDASRKRKANDIGSRIHDRKSLQVNGFANAAKRHKTSSSYPPELDDSSTSPLSEREAAIQEAQRFKDLHAKYVRVYEEVKNLASPPIEKVQRVRRMHKRLEELKRSITRSVMA